MKILLINPPIRVNAPPFMFPLGLGYVASTLIEDGHRVDVLDINGYRYTSKEVCQKIGTFDYEVVCIGGLITQYSYVKWLTRVIKQLKPQAKIIIGGGLASSIPTFILQKTDADIVVIGEGEITAKETVRTLESNGDLADVKGIYYKKGQKIVENQHREPIGDLAVLPLPAWHLFPMETYIVNQGMILGRTRLGRISSKLAKESKDGKIRSINVSAVRGCLYNCAYCFHTYYGYKVRLRPVDSIIKEIKALNEKYNIQFVVFADDLFVVSKKWVFEFCDKLLESGLKIKWSASGRVNLVDESLLRKMASAGCTEVGYGIESGSQKILDLMHKHATVEQAKRACKLTTNAGMNLETTYMIGFPGETKETIWETVKFTSEMGLPMGFYYTTPYPGTPLYEWAKANGKIKDEEAFIERLSIIGDVLKFAINLTDFSDEELVHLKKKAETESLIKGFPKKLLNYYRHVGFQGIAIAGIERLAEPLGYQVPMARRMR